MKRKAGTISYLANTNIPSLAALSMVVMKSCQAMAQEGYDVELIAPTSKSTSASVEAELWDHYGIRDPFPVRSVTASSRVRKFDYDLRSAYRVWRRRPALVYSMNVRLAALFSVLGWPVVFEAHDVPRGPLGASYFRWMLRGKGLRGIVAISRGLEALLQEQFGPLLSKKRLVVAHDGVDLERYERVPTPQEARAQLGLEPDGFVAGYTGHLYAGRGIELITELARRCPSIQFLLVGGHPESVERRRDEARSLHLSNVRYEGFVTNTRLPLYQAACDVLLMPYQRRVSFGGGRGDTSAVMSPGKMFEYMAAERLIVSSDHPVIKEVLTESNAVLCDPEDEDAWERALCRASTDTDWRGRLARNARRDVERYTYRSRVRQIFAELLGTEGRGNGS